jgi:hypothetical protein
MQPIEIKAEVVAEVWRAEVPHTPYGLPPAQKRAAESVGGGENSALPHLAEVRANIARRAALVAHCRNDWRECIRVLAAAGELEMWKGRDQ